MASKYLIDIILRTSKTGKGGADLTKELEGTEKATQKLGASWSSLAAIGAGVAGAFVAIKKAYDFGKEGAAIAQTAQSFDELNQRLGLTPDLLGRLRDASRGTVDDMTLMSSTTTLLAGTQGELATALGGATPQLMEIAKAANKLNPTLGDTTFLYQSLATGIKRSSPLILDNLGLTIKIGEANERFATKLGKTVEQLTAEEQKMALLEETLRAGQVMIDQVGGSTEAMGDSFAQAETAIKNATDRIKEELAPAIADAATATADFIEMLAFSRKEFGEVSNSLAWAEQSYEEYIDKVVGAAVASRALDEEMGKVATAHFLTGDSVRDLKDEMGIANQIGDKYISSLGIMTRAEYEFMKSVQDAAASTKDWIERQKEVKTAADYATASVEHSVEWHQTLAKATASAAKASGEAAEASGRLGGVMSNLIPPTEGAVTALSKVAIEAAAAANAEGIFRSELDLLHDAMSGTIGPDFDDLAGAYKDFREATAEGAEGLGNIKSELDAMSEAFRRNTNEMIYNIAEMQILDALEKGLIEDTNNSGTAYDEASGALVMLAEKLGLVDKGTVALTGAVQEQVAKFLEGESSAYSMVGGLGALSGSLADAAAQGDELTSALDRIPRDIDVAVNITSTWSGPTVPRVGPDTGPGADYGMMQHGGQFSVVGPAGPDKVPVSFMATRGEVVTVTPAGRTPPPNPRGFQHGGQFTVGGAQSVYVSGDTNNWYIQDQGSVALAMRLVENKRKERLNEFMGV